MKNWDILCCLKPLFYCWEFFFFSFFTVTLFQCLADILMGQMSIEFCPKILPYIAKFLFFIPIVLNLVEALCGLLSLKVT